MLRTGKGFVKDFVESIPGRLDLVRVCHGYLLKGCYVFLCIIMFNDQRYCLDEVKSRIGLLYKGLSEFKLPGREQTDKLGAQTDESKRNKKVEECGEVAGLRRGKWVKGGRITRGAIGAAQS